MNGTQKNIGPNLLKMSQQNSDSGVFDTFLNGYFRRRRCTNTFHLCVISRPDLIDMETLSRQSNRENLEQAFEIAESLGVTRLLDAEGETVIQNK